MKYEADMNCMDEYFISEIEIYLACIKIIFTMNRRTLVADNPNIYNTPDRRRNSMTKSQFLTNSVNRNSVNPEDVIQSFFKQNPVNLTSFSSKSSTTIRLSTDLSPMSPLTNRSSKGTTSSLTRRLLRESLSALPNSRDSETWNLKNPPSWHMEWEKTGPDLTLKLKRKHPDLHVDVAPVVAPVAEMTGLIRHLFNITNDLAFIYFRWKSW